MRVVIQNAREKKRLSFVLIFLGIFLMLPDYSQGGVMITRPGSSDSECAKKCKDEPEIDCRYYKWHKSKLTCFLSPKNDTSISRMKKIEKPAPEPGTKPASTWLNQLQARVSQLEKKEVDIKELKNELAELRTEMAGIKNSRALTHHLIRTHKEQQDKNMEAINDKLEVTKSEAKRMEDAIMTLGELQKSFGKKITSLNEEGKATGLSMAMVGQSNKDMKSTLRELTMMASATQKTISQFRKDITELEVRFAGLSTDVMEKAASIETMIGPEVKELRSSQTTLAQALSMITKKIMILTPRIPELQHLITINDGMVSVVTKKVKEFHDEITQLTGRVGFAESELRKFADPASKMNQDKRHLMARLREEVQVLSKSEQRLQNDVLMEITDRTRLYKEIADIKVGKKQLFEDVAGLQGRYKKMNKDMQNLILNWAQGDLISKILHRQVEVLKKMKSVKIEQNEMRKVVGNVSDNVKTMERNQITNNTMMLVMQRKALANLNIKILKLYGKIRNLTKANPELSMNEKRLLANLTGRLQKINKTQNELFKYMRDYADYIRLDKGNNSAVQKQSSQKDKDRVDLEKLKVRTNVLYHLLQKTNDKQKIAVQNQKISDQHESVDKVLNGQRQALQKQALKYLMDNKERKEQKQQEESKRLNNQLENLHKILLSLVKDKEKSGQQYPHKFKEKDENSKDTNTKMRMNPGEGNRRQPHERNDKRNDERNRRQLDERNRQQSHERNIRQSNETRGIDDSPTRGMTRGIDDSRQEE